MTATSVITPVQTRADKKLFLDLPYRAYRQDPNWRAPLRIERSMFINPRHNALLSRMEHQLFLARSGDQVVGRIAAFVNPSHLAQHNDGCGHFGFLDTLAPDTDLQHALLHTAEDWLRGRGLTKIGGPYSFSVNDECGLLVDGFDTPPMLMMPHGRPDYGPAMDSAGYVKAMDVFAFLYEFGDSYTIPPRVERMLNAASQNPDVAIRPMDMKNFKADVALILDIFNDAWSENWGFIPFNEDQMKTMASELRPLIKSDSLWIAMLRGEPVAFTLFLPDLNELTQGLDGRLLPFGWAKFLYRLKIKGETRSRLPLAGMRRKWHKNAKALQAIAVCYEAAFRAQYDRGVRTIESGWVLETNRDLINMCKLYDMQAYKTYRLYEKPL